MVKNAVQAAVKAMRKEVQALRAQNAEMMSAIKAFTQAPASTPAPPQPFGFQRCSSDPPTARSASGATTSRPDFTDAQQHTMATATG